MGPRVQARSCWSTTPGRTTPRDDADRPGVGRRAELLVGDAAQRDATVPSARALACARYCWSVTLRRWPARCALEDVGRCAELLVGDGCAALLVGDAGRSFAAPRTGARCFTRLSTRYSTRSSLAVHQLVPRGPPARPPPSTSLSSTIHLVVPRSPPDRPSSSAGGPVSSTAVAKASRHASGRARGGGGPRRRGWRRRGRRWRGICVLPAG